LLLSVSPPASSPPRALDGVVAPYGFPYSIKCHSTRELNEAVLIAECTATNAAKTHVTRETRQRGRGDKGAKKNADTPNVILIAATLVFF
jgi:hypothetical protein